MTIRDGDWVLVDFDHWSGRSVWSYFDGQTTHMRVDYPVEGLIRQNEEERKSAPSGWKGDWHKVASVPLNMAYSSGLVEAQNQHDDKFISKLLNDSDFSKFRTKSGSV